MHANMLVLTRHRDAAVSSRPGSGSAVCAEGLIPVDKHTFLTEPVCFVFASACGVLPVVLGVWAITCQLSSPVTAVRGQVQKIRIDSSQVPKHT